MKKVRAEPEKLRTASFLPGMLSKTISNHMKADFLRWISLPN
jgi:hypothetical protein